MENEEEYEPVTEEEIEERIKDYGTYWKRGESVHLSPRWFTPKIYVNACRELMGTIDVDPASSELAQKRIQAKVYHTPTPEKDAFKFHWYGKMMLNPNYTKELIDRWFIKAVEEFKCGNVTEGVILTHTSCTYEDWFNLLLSNCSAICFVKGKIKWEIGHQIDIEAQKRCGFIYNPKYADHGNCFFYLGENAERFRNIFSKFGFIMRPYGE